MHTTKVLRQNMFLFIVLFVVFALVLAACAMRGSGTGAGPTPPSTPTSATVPGYGTAQGCPSDIVVNTAPAAPNITIQPKQAATVINAHTGDVLEIQMPFGLAWEGPTASKGMLQLQSPSGYAWKASNACIWRFVAKDPGTVKVTFLGRAICKKVPLCAPSVAIASFTITVS